MRPCVRQHGNQLQKINALHIDEYKAKGTRSWEVMLRDEHGRLLFSARLKQRDQRHLQAILRWLHMLGLQIQTVYVDFWPAYPPAIRAIFPDAQIQYDFFHVIQNIHRHLYKALTAYRKAFKSASSEPAQRKARAALHKKLWEHRYLLFTNAENLSDEHQRLLQELLSEHADTLVEQIVSFRHCLRDICNERESVQQAAERTRALDRRRLGRPVRGVSPSADVLTRTPGQHLYLSACTGPAAALAGGMHYSWHPTP